MLPAPVTRRENPQAAAAGSLIGPGRRTGRGGLRISEVCPGRRETNRQMQPARGQQDIAGGG